MARDHKAIKFTGNSNKDCNLPSRRQTYFSDASSDPYIHRKKSSLLLQQVQVAAFTKRAFYKDLKNENEIPSMQGCCAPLLVPQMHSNC